MMFVSQTRRGAQELDLPVEPRRWHRLFSLVSAFSIAIGLLSGCTFDRSRLDQLQPASDDDNGAGNASDDSSAYDPDLSSADAGDISVDFSQTDGAATIDDTTELTHYDVGDNPDCPGATNPCGGCAPLPASPGDPCGTAECSYFVCSGIDSVDCVEDTPNACGGCDPLSETIGEPCGDCGGTWACDGQEVTFCDEPTVNACGGCGGPSGTPGEPCLCTEDLVEEHLWVCDGIDLVCADGNDAREQATILADSVDSMADDVLVEGALVGTDGEDWLVIFVRDSDDYSGLFPDLSLYNLSQDHDFCAYWQYADGSSADIWCDSGYEHTTDDGLTGCCSASEGLENEQVRLRNTIWWTNRLDVDNGADNDSGWLYVHIVGIPTETCESYTLQYRF